MRLKICISYDGTHFHGWQRQKNTPNTIQEIFETRLSQIANTRVTAVASGRTDAGVHARVQVLHAEVPETAPELDRLRHGLNSLLPPDIRVLLIEKAGADFHAQRDAVRKTYLYFIDPHTVQAPELRDYAWHLRLPLDWRAMEEATGALVGEHDFKAFCAADSTANTTVRTIFEARWGVHEWRGVGHTYPLRVLRLTGSGFLKNMVRSIAGTLVHIGGGKSGPELIRNALTSRDRKAAGPTAPPHGLWLWDVLYT
jgi:tRNA pseudouridine38-40 synthase